MKKDIAIIGAGPTGIFASFQAGLLGMNSVIIDALEQPGGQCSALYPEKPIYDIPSQAKISAQNLIDNLINQAKPFNPEYILQTQVNYLENKANGEIVVSTNKGHEITVKSVIIAGGAGSFGPNKPPLQDLSLYENNSIFYSVKEKELFRGKKILIAGGGDSAVDWAIALSEIADVTILHRRRKFRAALDSINKLHELESKGVIKLVIGYSLDKLKGDENNLSSVIVKNLKAEELEIGTDILLPFFGLTQNLGPLADFGLELSGNHIKANYPYFETNIAGVYGVGDIITYPGKLKLILIGFAECSAALHHAYSRVFDGKSLHFEYSTSKGVSLL